MVRRKSSQGFTLIELIFAMAGFSIMLIVAVSGFLNAIAIYNQANVSRDNQQKVRAVMEQLAGDIRTAKNALVASDSTGTWLCLGGLSSGDKAYYWVGAQNQFKQARPDGYSDCTAYIADSNHRTTDIKVLLQDANVFEATSLMQGEDINTRSVRVKLGVKRGSESSPRERQFSNAFSLQATYFLRGGL